MSMKKLSVIFLMIILPSMTGAQEDEGSTKENPLTTADPDVPLEDLRVMVKPLTKSELEVEANAWFELLRAKSRQISVLRLGVRKTTAAVAADDEAEAEAALKEVEQITETAEKEVEQTEEEITQSAQENLGVEENDPAEDDPPAEPEPTDNSTSTQTDSPAVDAASELKGNLLSNINELQDERSALYDRLTIVLDSLEAKGGEVSDYRMYAEAVTRVELETSDAEAAWSAVIGWLSSKEGGQRWAWNLARFVLVLIVAYVVSRIIATVVNWLLERKVHLSQLAEQLISNTIRNILLIVGFAVALTTLEIDVTPLLAAIGATGLVVGLALQDSLSNVASGFMILINRPFDVGHVVTAGGVTGTVNRMNLVSTTFRTFDNQTIYVPNNEIWNNTITNITANDTRRVDLEFGIGYDDDFEQAEQVIMQAVEDHELVLSDPAPQVVTHTLADSSVNIVCRPWVKTENWWQVKTDITREVKRRFDDQGISIPFPQRDIHLHSSEKPQTTESSNVE